MKNANDIVKLKINTRSKSGFNMDYVGRFKVETGYVKRNGSSNIDGAMNFIQNYKVNPDTFFRLRNMILFTV